MSRSIKTQHFFNVSKRSSATHSTQDVLELSPSTKRRNHPLQWRYALEDLYITALKYCLHLVQIEDGKWELSGPREVLVDVSSATCGSQYQHPIDRNHSEMVKYSNEYDGLYTRVKIALQPLVCRSQSKSDVGSTEVGSDCA